MNQVECPHCGRTLRYGARHVGKRLRCKLCGERLSLPDEAEPGEQFRFEETAQTASTGLATGGEHLALLFNGLTETGGAHFANFLNRAETKTAELFGHWLATATAAEVQDAARMLNSPEGGNADTFTNWWTARSSQREGAGARPGCCLVCGSPVDPAADRYEYHAYTTRKKINTDSLAGMSLITYQYARFYAGSDCACRDCIARFKVRQACIAFIVIVCVITLLSFIFTAIGLVEAFKQQHPENSSVAFFGILYGVGLLIIVLAMLLTDRVTYGQWLVAKYNRRRLRDQGFRVVGLGAEPKS